MNDTKEEIKTRLAMLLEKDSRTKEEKAEIHTLNTQLAELKKVAKEQQMKDTVHQLTAPGTPELPTSPSFPKPPPPQQIEDFGATDEDVDISEHF